MSLEGQQIDRYRILQLLGSGGMGDVYLAEDARIEQQVALKVIRAETSPYPDAQATQEATRLFQREARAVAKLDHPHILPLFDYGEERLGKMTLVYLVMPYRPEGSLADWLRQRTQAGLLSLQEVVHFVGQTASALQHAHDRQIIHQDVKPSNVLLRQRQETPTRPDVLLADFGIARFATATASASQSVRGTPSAMAPEQWEGHPVPATDQYALAVMAYELLVGRAPFQGGSGQMMYQHLMVPAPPPSSVNPGLSQEIDRVLLQALAKGPEARFASISAFATALGQAVQAMPAMAAPRPASRPPKGDDLRAVLAISAAEAQTGTIRMLPLPGGRNVRVIVPAGVVGGHVLRLEGQGEAAAAGGQAGALILTISVTHEQAPILIADAFATEQTAHAVNTVVPAIQAPIVDAMGSQAAGSNVYQPEVVTPASLRAQSPGAITPPHQPFVADGSLIPAQPPQRGISRRSVILGLAGLATVAVAGGSIVLLTHTQPPHHLTPTAVPNSAITSSGAMFGYDLARTHFNPDEHLLSSTNVSRLVLLWSAATGDQIDLSSPAVANGVVYVGSSDTKLYAFEASTGKYLWSPTTRGRIFSSPAVANGVVYVGSNDKKLYAFNATTGKQLWSVTTGTGISSSPAVANGVVYIGSVDRNLYAFEVGTGKQLWSATTGGPIESSPAVASGVLYVGSEDTKLYAFEANTGKQLWLAATGDIIISSPAVANGVVYVGSVDTKLYAFEASAGKNLWSAPTGGPIFSSPAVANGVVYVGSKDTKLYAFEANTGKKLWSAATGGVIDSSPAVANGVVYVGSGDKKLYAFEANTGKPLWSASTDGPIGSSPAVVNGVLYVGSFDTKLYAFHVA